MKKVSLSGSRRENVGKKDAKALRNSGNVPCVLYGGKEQIHFSVPTVEFKPLVYTPGVAFVDITIDGNTYAAILQDIQYHPVSDNIYHVDFKELVDDKKIVMSIPVKTTGLAKGVSLGGKMIVKLRKISVKAFPKDMPEDVLLDVTPLDMGQSIKIKDLNYENLELLDSPNSVVVTIRATRAVAAATRGGK
jgi:large subunit ribosomal protein L25